MRFWEIQTGDAKAGVASVMTLGIYAKIENVSKAVVLLIDSKGFGLLG